MRSASTAFATAIRESHQVATRVEVLSDDEVLDSVDLALEGTVTLDATAQTRGSLTCTFIDDGSLVPTSADSLLAPYGNELRVSRGLHYPDGTSELISLGVFRINDVTPTDTASGVQIAITGQDRSARIIDARFEAPYQVTAGTNYATAIQDVIEAAWPDVPTSFASTTLTTPQLIAEEGGDRWAFAVEMATAIGMALYFDGDGTLILTPTAQSVAEPAATISEGDDGVLLTAARRWTREGSFNRVIATGENTGETAPARGVVTDDDPASPTYYFGPFGRVPRFYTSPFITTDTQAEDAARAILARELGTTQQVNFGTLVDPRLEPGDVVQIIRAASGLNESHILDQLTIPLAATDAMAGRTRTQPAQ